ncbi:hypothetical protein SODALDRAFT_326990 [Sodiomyces alkalinus F11]|uniref:Uncharacterized protein n=1 Tax=Sodiomyces alkalinus (strain CBS 110278 / VKM F-3762 / F11) TaxID=1314773 RepID=A0A3N2Q7W1_SODAK|nr:hypothetical protein SODALDRAFT_326990 [Sodiomyces alkalinus F11]ROT42832.1 hypothetical protein SODALDRAFT_326990 [Sodiomyces alkalinus F11]
MSGRGTAISRPRGRPAKVTKPPIGAGRGRGNRPSVGADQLQVQLARADDEHHAGSQPPVVKHDHLADEEEDDGQEDASHAHPHQPQHQQFDIGASASPHAMLPNGQGQQPGGHQTADADIHPDLQNLVPGAHTGASQQPQQPQQPQQGFAMEAPMEAPMDTPTTRTAMEMAQESGYPELLIDSALAKRLTDVPGERLAVQRRQDQVLNLKRRSNVEALLAQVSGQEAHSPCKSCHKGYGPWSGCIVVSGQMCGSCANCWFNASGSRCSFHETNLPQAQQHIPAIQLQQAAGAAGAFAIPAAALAVQTQLQQQLAPQTHPGFAPGGLDQYVRVILGRAMVEARADDPHMRFQFRIETAARQLALATAEYNDFLAQEQQDHEQQQQQQQQAQAQADGGGPGAGQQGAPRSNNGPDATTRDGEGGD